MGQGDPRCEYQGSIATGIRPFPRKHAISNHHHLPSRIIMNVTARTRLDVVPQRERRSSSGHASRWTGGWTTCWTPFRSSGPAAADVEQPLHAEDLASLAPGAASSARSRTPSSRAARRSRPLRPRRRRGRARCAVVRRDELAQVRPPARRGRRARCRRSSLRARARPG